MTDRDPCPILASVDRHFAGRIRPADERAMREHLPTCVRCRTYYERRLLLSGVLPPRLPAEERLAIGLGLKGQGLVRSWAWPTAVLGACAAALVLLFLLPRMPFSSPAGLLSRGPHSRQSPIHLTIYRLSPGQAPQRIQQGIAASDELAFAYENQSDYKWLMIFGADEQKNIYWYYPAYRDPGQNPGSIAIQARPGVHELPEAIQHDLKGSSLRITALFTHQPLTVKEAEKLILSRAGPDDPLPVPGAHQESISLKVMP